MWYRILVNFNQSGIRSVALKIYNIQCYWKKRLDGSVPERRYIHRGQ